jgi:DNA-binding response OmpR family regulator
MSKMILIVDDDELTVSLLRSRLADSGYTVVVAKDGETALQQVMRERPEVIIMDIMLPDMQGSDVVLSLQKNSEFAKVQVIFLSGLISHADLEVQQIYVGTKQYPAISKPVDFRQLLVLLSQGDNNREK